MKKKLIMLAVTMMFLPMITFAEANKYEITEKDDVCKGKDNCAFCGYTLDIQYGCYISFSLTYNQTITPKLHRLDHNNYLSACEVEYDTFVKALTKEQFYSGGKLTCPTISYSSQFYTPSTGANAMKDTTKITLNSTSKYKLELTYTNLNTVTPPEEDKPIEEKPDENQKPQVDTGPNLNYDNICLNSGVSQTMMILGYVIQVIKWIAPLIIIVLGMVDYGKAAISGDDKALSGATASLIKRIVAGLIIFVVPTIISVVTKNLINTNVFDKANEFWTCTNCMVNPGDCEALVEKLKAEEEAKREEEQDKYEDGKDKFEDGNHADESVVWSENFEDINPDYPSKYLDDYPNISINYYNDFTYWVYLPKKQVENLPIVVFIGGKGHLGNDYETGKKNAIWGGPIDMVINKKTEYNAIVVTLQVPRDKTVYEFVNKYIKLLDKLTEKLNANKDKISIMGFSHGCYGVMTIVNKNPKYFSAAVPVGCTWNQKPDAKIYSSNFIHQPIWAITSSFDGADEGHVSLKTLVKYVNEKGGNAKYTNIKTHHDNLLREPISIVNDPDLDIINWMISQSK